MRSCGYNLYLFGGFMEFLGYQWGLVLNQPVYDCMAWGYNAFQIHHSFMKVNMAMEITIVATTSFTPGYKLPK